MSSSKFNPQQSGVAEKESRDVIFHHSIESSSVSDMESCENYHLEKQREKDKNCSVDLIENPIERIQGCYTARYVIDSDYSHYEESTKKQVWKDDIWKVILSY